MRQTIVLVSLVTALAQLPAFAQEPAAKAVAPASDMTRISGVVTAADNSVVTVRSADGETATMRILPNTPILIRKPARIADIQSSEFVGCTAVGQPDGRLRASECHIFPESMRGLGEGHNPMGPPDTTMTNGNITTMTNGKVSGASGSGGDRVIAVAYRNGSQNIVVNADTVVTRIEQGGFDVLKVGTRIAGGVRQAQDGSAVAAMVTLLP